jgi:hypothetical protein
MPLQSSLVGVAASQSESPFTLQTRVPTQTAAAPSTRPVTLQAVARPAVIAAALQLQSAPNSGTHRSAVLPATLLPLPLLCVLAQT